MSERRWRERRTAEEFAGSTSCIFSAILASTRSPWPARGANVTGVDYSPTALSRLADLAQRCDLSIKTVEADSRDLPHDLDGSFDLVYATVGVLCWIDDLDAWMHGVARVLRPGGTLVLVEMHPLLTMIDSLDPLILDFPYAFDGGHVYSGTGSYANRDADVSLDGHQLRPQRRRSGDGGPRSWTERDPPRRAHGHGL
jgi:SAM-dependent methyltransferase